MQNLLDMHVHLVGMWDTVAGPVSSKQRASIPDISSYTIYLREQLVNFHMGESNVVQVSKYKILQLEDVPLGSSSVWFVFL